MTGDLIALAAVFLRIGLLAFGGGTGVLPELERQVVQEHQWLTTNEFAASFALGQLKPGPTLLMVMFAGFRVAGVAGAVVSLFAIFLPSAVLMCVAIANWQLLRESPWLNSARRGLAAVAFGLTVAGAFTIARLAVADIISAVIAICAFGILLRWRIQPALVILLAGLVAFVLGLIV